jgi:hypothetical protein
MDYVTANSFVRPPSSPGMTPSPAGVTPYVVITWNAPAFGVVETYNIYRNVNGTGAVEIGSVSGVNGNPPGTTWTDFNPATGTVLYTITTTLLPVPIDPTSRQSQPSPPAVMKSEQTITLSLPGSVSISSSPVTITATAETNGVANGLQVNFVATGNCSIGSQSIASGISSASLNLNSTGSCNIAASQSGSSTYDAASSVSGSFTILSSGQSTQTQTISLSQSPGVQYGSGFSVNATSSSGIGVTFAASGPCTVGSTTGTATGATTGAGKCTITATAPANGNYSTATTVQSFTIYPAVLTVTAINLSSLYGQPLPSLTPVLGTTYTLSGFIGNDGASAVNGVPALSTTATSSSAPGTYSIVVTTGTLASTNYSFLYVNGTLTVDQPPSITSANTTTFAVGTLGSFAVTANGFPASMTYSKTGALPSGVTLSAAGVLSGTPAGGTGGSYPIAISASNGVSPAGTQNFTLVVDQAPAITSANTTTFAVGTAGTFTVTATGYPASMTYSKTGALPSGVTLSAAGVLSGTPAAGMGGSYSITITASNGVGSGAMQSFTLLVDQAPAITSANTTTFTVGASGTTFPVTASGFPAPTFTAAGTLPSGVTLSTAGVFSGTPAAGTGGSYPITITATNGITPAATQSFTLIVDQALAITSPNDATFKTGTSGTFDVTGTGYPTSTYTETGTLPSGVTLTKAGVLSGTPAAGAGGLYAITIIDSDGVLTNVTQSFTLTVDQAPAITSANSKTFTAGTAGSFTVTASGYPASMSYSYSGTLPTGVTLSTVGVLSGTPAAGTGGSYPITITASNGITPAGTQSFTLIVDQAPAIASANNATFTVGTAGTFSVTTTGYPASTITESGPLPSGVTFVNNANGTGTLSGKATVSGIYPITFTASNGVGTAATQSFTLTSETTVPASGTTCSGVYTGTFSGNITVSTGQNCIFVKGGATGNITETGGYLALSSATVSGNVQISGGGIYSIGPSTTIKGNLVIQAIPKGTAQNQICGTTVSGITLQSDGTAATIGAGTPSCPGNTILGSLTLQANIAAVTVSGNSIGGSLTDQSNTAATTFSGNTVSGSLTDQGNSGASVLSLNSITGTLVVQSNSGTSDVSQNTVGGSMTDQGNTALTQVVSNKVTGTLLCQSNTSITGSGDTASKLEGQCATF